ncbi:uncharacterized protein EDB91DRAFT_1333356 [Suillus paluster]|uniref:uncharacterized protein n=1 Tax=Suillus paluster TaxID=48578 RepID=UPI001B8846CB|nr:uncharacterized protein EDB91DRAFT_1333356 [Suillus paluster]KAG1752291.1 hypothetical protein EDB91DRAFT_1333356 [Suillus paluster]
MAQIQDRAPSLPNSGVRDTGIDVIVVGAGFGGIACAIECKRKGYRVMVFEKLKTESRRRRPAVLPSMAQVANKETCFGAHGAWILDLIEREQGGEGSEHTVEQLHKSCIRAASDSDSTVICPSGQSSTRFSHEHYDQLPNYYVTKRAVSSSSYGLRV